MPERWNRDDRASSREIAKTKTRLAVVYNSRMDRATLEVYGFSRKMVYFDAALVSSEENRNLFCMPKVRIYQKSLKS